MPGSRRLAPNPTVTVNYKAVSGTPIKHDLDLKNFQEAYAFYVAADEDAHSVEFQLLVLIARMAGL